nr:ATP-binding cassette domain-containing protein [Marinicella sp. W31]MDC2879093.1 ATP-binding cassette domain-containing protein [Marinicella sp. W31]
MALRIEATGLSISRGDMLIFSDLSLVLEAGESMVFTGANGAGKSTALRALLGLAGDTGGDAMFLPATAKTACRFPLPPIISPTRTP